MPITTSPQPQYATQVHLDGGDVILRFRADVVRVLREYDAFCGTGALAAEIDTAERAALRKIVELGAFFETFGFPNGREIFDQFRASAQQQTGVTFRMGGG